MAVKYSLRVSTSVYALKTLTSVLPLCLPLLGGFFEVLWGEGGGGCSVPHPWGSCLPRNYWRGGDIWALKGVMLGGNQMLLRHGDFGQGWWALNGLLIDFPENL